MTTDTDLPAPSPATEERRCSHGLTGESRSSQRAIPLHPDRAVLADVNRNPDGTYDLVLVAANYRLLVVAYPIVEEGAYCGWTVDEAHTLDRDFERVAEIDRSLHGDLWVWLDPIVRERLEAEALAAPVPDREYADEDGGAP